MSPIYTRSLGKSLAFSFMVIVMGLWLGLSVLYGIREIRRVQVHAIEHLRHDLGRLQLELENALAEPDKVEAERLLTLWAVDPDLKVILLADDQGRIDFANRLAWKGLDAVKADPLFEISRFASVRQRHRPVVFLGHSHEFVQAYYPVAWMNQAHRLRGQRIGILYARYDLGPQIHQLWMNLLNSTLVLGTMVILALGILWRQLKAHLIQPLAHMTEVARHFGEGDLGVRMELEGQGELIQLTKTFNQMADKIAAGQRLLERQKSLYDTLAETNQVIIRAQKREEVFDALCRIAVERAGFKLAWVGVVDEERKVLILEACAANDESCKQYVESLWIPLDNTLPEGRGPAATAVLEDRSVVINDFLKNPLSQPWHRQASRFQLASCASFPIHCDAKVVGVFLVYAEEENYFSEDLLILLTELASDISFALENFEREAQRKKAETALRASEQRLQVTLDSIGDAVIATDAHGKVERMNPMAERLTGWNKKDVLGKPLVEVFHIVDAQTGQPAENPVEKVFADGKVVGLANDTVLISKDGRRFQIADSAAPMRDHTGAITGVVLVFRDVTETYALQKKLLASEARYRHLFEKGKVAALLIDEKKRIIIDANDAACRFYGYSRNEMQGMPLDWIEEAHVIEEGNEAGPEVYSHRLRSGQRRQVELHASQIEVDSEMLLYVTVHDVTEQRKIDYFTRLLAEDIGSKVGEDFFQTMVRQLGEGLEVDYAFVGTLNQSSLQVEVLNGWSKGEWVKSFRYELENTPCANVVSRGACIFPRGVQSLFPQDHLLVEMKVEGYAGTPLQNSQGNVIGILVICDTKPLTDENYILSVLRMFAARASAELERQKAEQEIQRLAFYDPLTNLPNRRLFMDRLRQELGVADRHRSYGALMFLDLDNFKHLNDAWGHQVGDALLVQVSERLRQHLRVEDTVARLGGDEFVVLLPELEPDSTKAANQVRIVAEKIKKHIAAPYELNGQSYQTSISIGITLFAGPEAPDDLLKQADTAMYRAKSMGRNAICFYLPAMQVAADVRLQMEKDLRAALEQNQLQLYFQPQHNVAGDLVGVEALLRWYHPEDGWVPPNEFIPIAEESGLILPLGQWVLKEACRYMGTWQSQPFFQRLDHLAVNISPRQFHQAGFVEQVQSVLKSCRINARKLMLELTENIVIEDINDTITKIRALKRLGVRFSIDDFGTGYSSLLYLKRLPLDQLKIDRSFINDIAVDANDCVIIETMLSMARHLGLDVVAEGVENEVQRQFLKSHGCPIFQGFFYSPPLPEEDFIKYASKSVLS
ncbi:MAG: hypothetical protein AXA67_13545 [Methylothermaceae bacteria B42]|nr:MAG: hypothetical protein AXA67_13545 [Methylothermaceae bacteria B42]HHJ38350.1 EAL domain-containing protein [Methylothermaceae bacterium]